ncbi:DUF1566 domain-containing protein [Pseudomonadales bacterium]|nr:DUF1566 domain-containing protein [Pseudomonadales bacterium]
MKNPLIAATLLALSCSSNAALEMRDLDGDLSNGHEGVYDDVLDITWLANANSAGGQLSWNAAEDFVTNLNSTSHLGVTAWRQPTASNCVGTNCGNVASDTDDELGYQFFQNFGATAGSNITSGTNSTNLALFSNVQNDYYWTGFDEGGSTLAYFFNTDSGTQSSFFKSSEFYVWAVTDGMAGTAVPVPAAAWLLGSALAGLLMVRRKQS